MDKSGPAFPNQIEGIPDSNTFRNVMHGGMSLRDYFAAHAIDAVYREYFNSVRNGECQCEPGWATGLAQDCYVFADAMLAAREPKDA